MRTRAHARYFSPLNRITEFIASAYPFAAFSASALKAEADLAELLNFLKIAKRRAAPIT